MKVVVDGVEREPLAALMAWLAADPNNRICLSQGEMWAATGTRWQSVTRPVPDSVEGFIHALVPLLRELAAT